MYAHAYQSFVWNSVVTERILRYGATKVVVGDLITTGGQHRFGDDRPEDVVVVESEEVALASSIFDVVLPLPGQDVRYPANDLAAVYEEVMSRDSLSLEDFQSRVKEYNLAGSYRRIIERARDFVW